MSYVLSNIEWGGIPGGTGGAQVTWSFATSSYSEFFNRFDGLITQAAFQDLVRDAFDAWESVALIDFVEVADGINSDIRLGWDAIGGPSATLAETAYSHAIIGGVDTFLSAEIRFDTAESWSTDKDYAGSSLVNFYAVALHQIGHAIGLGNSRDPSTIMFEFPQVNDLSPSDIEGAGVIYGPVGGEEEEEIPLIGTDGDDSLTGTDAGEVMVGHDGDDTIDAGAGDDAVWAGGGDTGSDELSGGTGNDTLGGGAGNDTLVGGTGSDLMFGGDGNDLVHAGDHGLATADGFAVVNAAWGGEGNDSLTGDDTNDVLGGGAGADVIAGAGGADTIYGGGGDALTNGDDLDGGDGDDVVYGGGGEDDVEGGAGSDLLFGGADNDEVSGGDGEDEIWGGAGENDIGGGAGDDRLYGGDDDDRVYGGDGDDEIWGGAGDDDLFGEAGADVFGFVQGSGVDAIYQFVNDEDRIDLSDYGAGFASFADLQPNIVDITGGVSIQLDAGDTIIVYGVASIDLDGSDFLF